jgi:hypothetical protein
VVVVVPESGGRNAMVIPADVPAVLDVAVLGGVTPVVARSASLLVPDRAINVLNSRLIWPAC